MTSSFAVFYVKNFLVNILYLMFVSNYSVSDVAVDEEDSLTKKVAGSWSINSQFLVDYNTRDRFEN